MILLFLLIGILITLGIIHHLIENVGICRKLYSNPYTKRICRICDNCKKEISAYEKIYGEFEYPIVMQDSVFISCKEVLCEKCALEQGKETNIISGGEVMPNTRILT